MKRPQHIRGKLATTAIASLFIALYLIGGSVVRGSTETGSSQMLTGLESLRNRVAAQDDFYVRWNASLRFDLGGEISEAEGSYEFWRSGDRFRIRSITSGDGRLVNDLDLAFDGEQTYLLDETTGILAIEPFAPMNEPSALPNPMLLKFAFLDVDPPDCPTCRLRLRDLLDDGHWTTRTAVLDGGDESFLAVSSGRQADPVFRIFRDEQGDVLRIERSSPTGELEARFVFTAGSAARDLFFPARVHGAVFQSESPGTLEFNFEREVLLEDQSWSLSDFQIGSERAERVWDGSTGRFVETAGR